MDLDDTAPATRSLEFVALSPRYDIIHHLTNLKYCLREIVFSYRSLVRLSSELIHSCHCVDIFGF